MSLYNKIYAASPIWFQNFMVSVYGYKWKKRRLGGIFEEEYKAAKTRESFTEVQWNNYQNEGLKKMLMHAFKEVPYYNESFKKAGLTENDLRTIDISSISQIPILSKEDLRKCGTTSLMAKNREEGGAFFSSSGSTGTPVQICYSKAMHQRWFGITESRLRNWAGLTNDNARGMIGGRRIVPDAANTPPFYRYNYFEKQVYFSAYHIAPSNLQNYLEAFSKYKIEYMTGYAMSNYFLARMFQEHGIKPPKLKAVLTSSEKLTKQMRDTLSEVYQCKVYDGWSGMEYCGLISECEHGSLHISPDAGLIEILDNDMNPVMPGVPGNVYCTGFLNFDQPLIRYKIGDEIIMSNKACACGREMPVVQEIVGRVEDVVIGKDGREMVRFHGIFVGLKTVKMAQVIQHSLDELTIKVVVDGVLDNAEKSMMLQRVVSQLGDIKINIVEVDNIPRTAAGKIKAVISEINR